MIKNKIFPYFIALQLIATSLLSLDPDLAKVITPEALGIPSEDSLELTFQNRVLAKIGSKAITVLDVMKKMDMIFFREFPQYAKSSTARFQFYDMNWRAILGEMIDNQLVLSDAEELKMPISRGDVRQEIEQIFGPNIIQNLDQAGLTLEEAMQMIKDSILIRRMTFFKVNMMAQKKVTPQKIKSAYDEYLKNFEPKNEWTYQVLSIRDPNPETNEKLANEVSLLLKEKKVPIDKISEKKSEIPSWNSFSSISLSEEYKHIESEVSPQYLEVLQELKIGAISSPIKQKNRKDNATFFRIFYLKGKKMDHPLPFKEKIKDLESDLLERAYLEEHDHYFQSLRDKYHLNKENLEKEIPSDFRPFSIQPKV